MLISLIGEEDAREALERLSRITGKANEDAAAAALEIVIYRVSQMFVEARGDSWSTT